MLHIAVIIMGFAYSLLASALWPIVALIIPEYQLGTAYGLMQVINHSTILETIFRTAAMLILTGVAFLINCDR